MNKPQLSVTVSPRVTAPYSIAFIGVEKAPAPPTDQFETLAAAVEAAKKLPQPKATNSGGGVFVMGTLNAFGRKAAVPVQRVEAE